jgi:hypothetical protein
VGKRPDRGKHAPIECRPWNCSYGAEFSSVCSRVIPATRTLHVRTSFFQASSSMYAFNYMSIYMHLDH